MTKRASFNYHIIIKYLCYIVKFIVRKLKMEGMKAVGASDRGQCVWKSRVTQQWSAQSTGPHKQLEERDKVSQLAHL